MGVVLLVLGVYLAAGVVFALVFVTAGVGRVDAAARGAGIGFRAIIAPGCAALWPALAVRWARAARRAEGGNGSAAE